ncbi:armadillo-type fold protein [Artemisia annua]|uniref:Armadillo-type fold protein n=1 Tax=Artemisia annua TaxID=35608 RepID=A0A2U1K8S4_ARTAN|nr:armadillo-type fold protein [Artemisia annua]
MGDLATQLNEMKTLLLSCVNSSSKSEKSNLYSTLLQLQEHSVSDEKILKMMADSCHVLLELMVGDVSDDDEEM